MELWSHQGLEKMLCFFCDLESEILRANMAVDWHELAVYFQFMNRVRAFHQTSITIIMSYMAIGFVRKTTSRLHWIQS